MPNEACWQEMLPILAIYCDGPEAICAERRGYQRVSEPLDLECLADLDDLAHHSYCYFSIFTFNTVTEWAWNSWLNAAAADTGHLAGTTLVVEGVCRLRSGEVSTWPWPTSLCRSGR